MKATAKSLQKIKAQTHILWLFFEEKKNITFIRNLCSRFPFRWSRIKMCHSALHTITWKWDERELQKAQVAATPSTDFQRKSHFWRSKCAKLEVNEVACIYNSKVPNTEHNGIWISLFITWLSSITLTMSIYSYTFDFCTFKNYTFKSVIFKSGFFRFSRHFWFLPFQKLHFWKWVDRLWSFQYILIDVTLCLFCNHDNGTYLKMRFE